MTSKESLNFLVKHGEILKKEKVDELKNIVIKDIDKLEKIKSIVDDTNDKINETIDISLINFLINQAFNKIIEVLENE